MLKTLTLSLLLSTSLANYAQTSFLDFPDFEKNADEARHNLDVALQEANLALDRMASLPDSEITFDNSARALDDIYYQVRIIGDRVGLLGEVSPDAELREEAKKITSKIQDWSVEVESRADIFRVLKYCDTHPQCQPSNAEDALLLKKMTADYQRAGFDLPPAKQEEMKKLKKEISDLEITIGDNISKSNNDILAFSKEELVGLTPNMLEQITDEQGNYRVRLGVQAETILILENASLESARKKVFAGMNSVAQDTNPTLMTTVIKKRAQLAQLLGYKSWADYRTEFSMAKNGDNAYRFIKDLSVAIEPKFQREMENLRQLKVSETGDVNARIESWDARYFQQKYLKSAYNIDMESLKKYFELNNVLSGMFHIFEYLFKIKIEYVTAPYVWHPDVKMIKISDAVSGEELGYLYLDLFPRPDDEKYGHFAMFTIRSGKLLQDGRYRRPASALVCNFPRPTAGAPSLLSFDHVQTLFHEFGHGLHSLLTLSRHASFSGTNTVHDFVEAPSQVLERWTLDKDVLDTFAYNYQDPTDKIPALILDRIKESETAKVGMHYRRQFAFGLMDLKIHGTIDPEQDVDIVKVTNDVLKEVYLPHPEGSAFIATFGHLFGGYDAGYYGYAWSDNIAADMASVFENSPKKFLDEELGMRLRKEVYEVGGSRDENISAEKFLGRKPGIEAFLKQLGI